MSDEIDDHIKRLREEIAATECLIENHENHSPHYSQIGNREHRARKERVAQLRQALSELMGEKREASVRISPLK